MTPNDPNWGSQWGKQRIDCPDAWDITTGDSNLVIAVLDTGVDLDHPDLVANLWTNQGEAGALSSNGIDDDGNGYIDDWIGWDFGQNDNDPDDNADSDYDGNTGANGWRHGTHCSGIIGAVGNNSTQIAGVCWNIKIMALKPFLYYSTYNAMLVPASNANEAMAYATENGARITSNSYGGIGDPAPYYDGVYYQYTNDVLFVVAAGNDGLDTDITAVRPAGVDLPNVVAVGNSTSSETISGTSNYGATTVDLFAPGSSILSTVPNGSTASFSGTSMACPQVAGAAGLLLSDDAALTSIEIKNKLMASVEIFPVYTGKCLANGRMNVNDALNLSGFPTISNDYTSITISADTGMTGQETLNISNVGTGTLNYAISDDVGGGGYNWKDSDAAGGPSYSWIDITGSGTSVALADDGESSLYSIGFSFPFYGSSYSQFQIGANGVVSFVSGDVGFSNGSLPSSGVPSLSLLPLWDDLNPASGGSIYYHTDGSRLVVSWIGVPFYNTSDNQTFQAIIYPDGRIVYQYQTLNGTLTSNTIGLQGNLSDRYVEVVNNTSYVKNSFAIEFTASTDWLSYSPTSGTVAESGSTPILFTANAAGLTDGSYTGNVALICNDPNNATVNVPFYFHVGVADGDADGMPDAWETLYFGGPGNADPSDLAANGVNTLLEAYIAGLNPTNSSNVFEINNFDADYDGLDSRHVMWSTASNRVYSIYWSPDLMHTPFTLMQSNILGGAFTDMVHGAESDGYYKVKVQLP